MPGAVRRSWDGRPPRRVCGEQQPVSAEGASFVSHAGSAYPHIHSHIRMALSRRRIARFVSWSFRASTFALTSFALAACASGGGPGAGRPQYDLLITNGRIVDGTGNPWYYGDVAVKGDRIAAVGRMPGARARRTIDARGLVVSPGFIDMLGHSERSILNEGTRRAISKVSQGITSEITGEVNSAWPNTRPASDPNRRGDSDDP